MMNNEATRLLKNSVAVVIIGVAVYFSFHYFFGTEDTDLKISDTNIQVESIRTIAEISTVSYTDEVVIDTVEHYKQSHSFYDPREWARMYDHNVKRRLTLIIKGEVKYGIDLTDNNYTLESNEDTVWVELPEPKIIDVIITPSKTEVFQEQGDWSDGARKEMESKAKEKLKLNAGRLNLRTKASENAERLFKTLFRTDKHLIIEFKNAK
jgi:Protein of unknown function (DUF4230)